MSPLENLLDRLFTRRRWIIHVVFWMLVLAFYSVFFGRQNSNYLQTFFFVAMLLPVTVGTTYCVNYFLVPRFLLKEKYMLFILYFFYSLVISVFLEMMMVVLTFIFLAEHKIRNMSPASIDVFLLLTALLTVVFLSLAVKLLLHWRTSKEGYQRLMREKLEAELKFLKTQLHPHFLFNTLNNLYYLTTEKSERAPGAILQLSEILDYVMHGSRDVYVPVEKEWRQVRNYIDLELLRYEDRLRIDAQISPNTDGYTIAPMMLITLVENAFKHGVMRTSGKAWIKMDVKCEDEAVKIVVSNGRGQGASKNGIGLTNLRNQLGLLYPSRHTLLIDGTDNEFKVELILSGKRQ